MSDGTSANSEPGRTFEQALGELEERVRKLERGELPLEQALSLYEEGVALQRECQDLLDHAEQRIIELSEGPTGLLARARSLSGPQEAGP